MKIVGFSTVFIADEFACYPNKHIFIEFADKA